MICLTCQLTGISNGPYAFPIKVGGFPSLTLCLSSITAIAIVPAGT
ncbi:MAG: hypothetical protein HN892_07345 [Thiotrichales bacterium]|nr:hypothetical protein [Thiotrichales bacterium]